MDSDVKGKKKITNSLIIRLIDLLYHVKSGVHWKAG